MVPVGGGLPEDPADLGLVRFVVLRKRMVSYSRQGVYEAHPRTVREGRVEDMRGGQTKIHSHEEYFFWTSERSWRWREKCEWLVRGVSVVLPTDR